jgi:hypothetical protein
VNARKRVGLDLLGVKNLGHCFNLYQWLHAFAPVSLIWH